MQTPTPNPRWYGVRSKIKQEHIAAGALRKLAGVEVFCPRLRFKKTTRRGRVWFTEALFPNYLFARFDFSTQQRLVNYANGVSGLLHFGAVFPDIPDAVIAELRKHMEDGEVRVIDAPVVPGDEITVLTGPFAGLEVLVTRVLPARQRVQILLNFLGRQVKTEVSMEQIATRWENPVKRAEFRKA